MTNILIGITGSIAAYKSIFLIRNLNLVGHNLKVVISAGGAQFVTPGVIAGLGVPVYCDQDLNLNDPAQAMLHINLAKWADLILIAPASANTLAKLASGMASNLLEQILLVASDKPRFLAPAMNMQMWANSLTQENCHKLQLNGYVIWGPEIGIQACGDNGTGRMLEPEQLLNLITSYLQVISQQLANKTLLITLGGTVEALDPVRYLSNHSSGKMGVALINSALESGAQVIALVAKISVDLPTHPRLCIVKTMSAYEMLQASLDLAAKVNLFIACAAVCDYRVATISQTKLKKNADRINLELVKNPDILASCKAKYPNLFCVGFAAETNQLLENACQKVKNKNLDLLVANEVGENLVFGQDQTLAYLIDRNLKISELGSLSKIDTARAIMLKIANQL